jgi:glycosyltransferase involved in cell wall biosynthesis
MMKHYALFFLCIFFLSTATAADKKKIYVVIPSYNNAEWYINNLSSIFMQEYENYHIIYIDDASDDGTADLVAQYIQEAGQQQRVTLIRNTEHKGHLYNHIYAVSLIPDDAIVVHIDGDDWFRLDELVRTDIFTMLNEIYQNPNVWLTYGSYYRYPYGNAGTCQEFPEEVVRDASYRQYQWVSSHLRTFYAWLFKLINPADFLYTGTDPEYVGKLWPAAADLSFMFPMLEMANGRYRYIPDLIYAYNRANPLNLCIGDRQAVQRECAALVRAKPNYAPLPENYNYLNNGTAHGA